MGNRKFLDEANIFCNAIEEMAKRPENLTNFRCYLLCHFSEWLHEHCITPMDMALEMKTYAEMKIELY